MTLPFQSEVQRKFAGEYYSRCTEVWRRHVDGTLPTMGNPLAAAALAVLATLPADEKLALAGAMVKHAHVHACRMLAETLTPREEQLCFIMQEAREANVRHQREIRAAAEVKRLPAAELGAGHLGDQREEGVERELSFARRAMGKLQGVCGDFAPMPAEGTRIRWRSGATCGRFRIYTIVEAGVPEWGGLTYFHEVYHEGDTTSVLGGLSYFAGLGIGSITRCFITEAGSEEVVCEDLVRGASELLRELRGILEGL